MRHTNLGITRPELLPTKHPTTLDIAWVAGLFEGEGHCYFNHSSCQANIYQKDREILDKARDLFGGSVRWNGSVHTLYIHGKLARGLLMTIYKFMSIKRKNEIRASIDPLRKAKQRTMKERNARRTTKGFSLEMFKVLEGEEIG